RAGALQRQSGPRLGLLPTEFDLPAHPRACGDRKRAGLEVAIEHAGLEKLDARSSVDISLELTGNDNRLGAHATGDFRAELDREIAAHADVPVESTSDTDVSHSLDLAFDRHV